MPGFIYQKVMIMFTHIKSMEALRQKTDFCGGNITKIVKRGSDIDFTYELANGNIAVIEEKKNTPNHSVENIINSWQWKHYRKVCRDEHFLIYVTHDLDISSEDDIPLEALTVRYLEANKQEIKLQKEFKLDELVNYLGSLDTYYVKVRYKNGTVEYALKHPIEDKWSSDCYWAASVCFLEKESAYEYVKARYKKPFNQEYVYELWYIDENGKHSEIDKLHYQNKN